MQLMGSLLPYIIRRVRRGMDKFCGKCGSKLDEATGLCPNCVAEKIKRQAEQPDEQPKSAEKRSVKKRKSKEKRARLTSEQKIRRFFVKRFLWLILFIVIASGAIAWLSYMGIIDIPFLSDFNRDNILETLNERAIVVEETDIVMETDTEGTATVIVKMPNYELLFKEAYASKNPDQYLVKALVLGNYEIREYEEVATVTVADDVTTIHSDEVVHKLLEEALINAINALSEVER